MERRSWALMAGAQGIYDNEEWGGLTFDEEDNNINRDSKRICLELDESGKGETEPSAMLPYFQSIDASEMFNGLENYSPTRTFMDEQSIYNPDSHLLLDQGEFLGESQRGAAAGCSFPIPSSHR